MKNRVATGRNVVLALGREKAWQRGGLGLKAHDPVLPTAGRLRQERTVSPAVSRSGVTPRGTPGSITGEYPFEALLTAEHALDMALAILGTVTKTDLGNGVFQYVFENRVDAHADVSFFGIGGLPPLYRQQLYGIRFANWQTVIESGKQATLKASGHATHGSVIGLAVPAPGNTGTALPRIRGRMANPDAGDIHVRVASLAPLQFEVEVSTAALTWPGTFIYDAELDPVSGDHRWQNLRDQAGQDIGRYDEAKNLVELYFGDAAALADYRLGDIFTFPRPGTWPTPALVQAGGHVFTFANYRVEQRLAGSSDPWVPVRRLKATIETMTELEEDRGDDSNYMAQLLHTGVYGHKLTLERNYVDTSWDDLHDGDGLLAIRHGFTGRLLDPVNDLREQVLWNLPAMELMTLTNAPSGEGVVKETGVFEAKPDPDGGAPIQLTVITDIDWTP